MDPTLVLFGIQAGLKVGKKVNDILVDDTKEDLLVLPLGDLFGSIQVAQANMFFNREENFHLIEEGGPYHGFNSEQKLSAYKTILKITDDLGNSESDTAEAVDVVVNINKFEQYKKGFGANPPVQRLLGTIVEIGIDYLVDNPQTLGNGSSARPLLESFVQSLDEVDFSEDKFADVAGEVLVASLKILGDHTSLVSSDKRIQVLLGGITKSLIEDMTGVNDLGAEVRRKEFYKRVTGSILKGGIAAFNDNAELFIQGNDTTRDLVRSTLTQFINGFSNNEDLFTTETTELLFRSALGAVTENPEFINDEFLRKLLTNSIASLTSANGQKIFSKSTIPMVLRSALQTVGENSEMLVSPDTPERQFLANALSSITLGLSSELVDGNLVKLFSSNQMANLAEIIFKEIGKEPELLLGDVGSDEKKAALTQIIASVAGALGDNPRKYITGEGAVDLLHLSLRIGLKNIDKLLDLDSDDPKTNLLYQVLKEVISTVGESGDPRKLLTRDTILDIVTEVLPIISSNLDSTLADQDKLVGIALNAALNLANDALKNRIDGVNLPDVTSEILRQALAGLIDPNNDDQILEIVIELLNAV